MTNVKLTLVSAIVAIVMALTSCSLELFSQQAQDSTEFNLISMENPSIRLAGGLASSAFKQSNTLKATNSLYSAELDLGFSDVIEFDPGASWFRIMAKVDKTLPKHYKLGRYVFNGFFFSYVRESETKPETSNVSSVFSFGFNNLNGHGYKLKLSPNSNLKFLYGSNGTWSLLQYNEMLTAEQIALSEQPDFSIFGTAIRYGKRYQSEISWQVSQPISIFVNANRTLVYPRTMFWKMAGSEIIFSITEGLLSIFTNSIKTSKNVNYYPIVDWVLKTGLYFGLSELQKNKMNFPFETVSPMSLDHIRIGMQIDF